MYKAEIHEMEIKNKRSYENLKEKINKINSMVDSQIEMRRLIQRNRTNIEEKLMKEKKDGIPSTSIPTGNTIKFPFLLVQYQQPKYCGGNVYNSG